MLVYSEHRNSRIKYALGLVLNQVLGLAFRITDSAQDWEEYQGPKLNYSHTNKGEIRIKPYGLLAEKTISCQSVVVEVKHGLPTFFRTDGDLGFDVFSAAFYLATRYEEYLDRDRDKHGRFTATQSLAWKHNFLDRPIINEWAEKLKSLLLKRFQDLKFSDRQFRIVNTIDVDSAYAYRGKPMKRLVGGALRSVIKGDVSDLRSRVAYLLTHKDPFDTYAYLKEVQEVNNVESVFFFLVANGSKFDRGLGFNGVLKDCIAYVNQFANVGIHPSYQSSSKLESTAQEIEKVSQVIRSVNQSRMHFLRLLIPDTYDVLEGCGVTDDYTMGYADHYGFRSGLCTPFRFYNLQDEKEMNLTVHNTAYMDGTLKDYMGLNPEQAVEVIKELKQRVAEWGGEFIGIWHNDTVNDKGKWQNWNAVFEEAISTTNFASN